MEGERDGEERERERREGEGDEKGEEEVKGDFNVIILTPLLLRDVLRPYKEVSLPFPQLASCMCPLPLWRKCCL